MHLDTLPIEISYGIFQYVTLYEIAAIDQTCRALHSVLSTNEDIWRNGLLRDYTREGLHYAVQMKQEMPDLHWRMICASMAYQWWFYIGDANYVMQIHDKKARVHGQLPVPGSNIGFLMVPWAKRTSGAVFIRIAYVPTGIRFRVFCCYQLAHDVPGIRTKRGDGKVPVDFAERINGNPLVCGYDAGHSLDSVPNDAAWAGETVARSVREHFVGEFSIPRIPQYGGKWQKIALLLEEEPFDRDSGLGLVYVRLVRVDEAGEFDNSFSMLWHEYAAYPDPDSSIFRQVVEDHNVRSGFGSS
ncbi:hypothetical protein POJ06DRAFT_238129 [Lipomyces tetrasporus]|uniref:F-box domain-containing protein n=1 Tax=Lipomyces tetrasporus TaxID=54092 RepID=A0AAD7QSD1_9ASCO|nr:uncharacterized protein POJ06DRAFT_238129 [Lipomyces tetrasporus]KAJ8100632.1 hypothetical protein POJ06DRAFT_238129 [Lipomyces tetrasporus]